MTNSVWEFSNCFRHKFFFKFEETNEIILIRADENFKEISKPFLMKNDPAFSNGLN